MKIIKYPLENFETAVCEFLFQEWSDLSNRKDKIFIALSGGGTPIPILELLSRKSLPWEKFHFFIVDERIVDINSASSNYGNIYRSFLSKVPCSSYPMLNHLDDVENKARDYSNLIYRLLPLNNSKIPVFDQILLGMGDDGHVASLFANTDGVTESKEIVVSNYVEKLETNRITFTFPLINCSNKNLLIFKNSRKKAIFDAAEGLPVNRLKTDYVLFAH